MGRVGNITNTAAESDMTNPSGPSTKVGYKSGRRVNAGGSSTAGGPGVKEQHLKDARKTSLAHKHVFRSGAQDARMGGDQSGPKSASALQLKTRRRGNGSAMIVPAAHGSN